MYRSFFRLSAACFLTALSLPAAAQTVVEVDLTQPADDANPNAGTWQFGGNAAADSVFLDFASSDNTAIALDGGTATDDYQSAAVEPFDFTHGAVRATFVGRRFWKIEGVHPVSNAVTMLGYVSEYRGALTHVQAHNYSSATSETACSEPPVGAGPQLIVGTGAEAARRAWLWLYRSSIDQTVSFHLVVGSSRNDLAGDDGNLRGVIISVADGGTPVAVAMNDNAVEFSGANPFTGNWTWVDSKNDGGGIGQMTTATDPTDSDGDGLVDSLEVFFGSNPQDADTDDDGIVDGMEPNLGDDTDGDGLRNVVDYDSDNDGLPDGLEVGSTCADPATDPAKCRPDGDAGATTTDPLNADTDSGTVSDGAEDSNLNGVVDGAETDPNVTADDVEPTDTDNDGLSDDLEVLLGTDPNDADSDDDGIRDGDEPNFSDDTDGDGLINPLDVDSDNDGLFDGVELGSLCDNAATMTPPCRPDADGGTTTTSALNPDTDGGGMSDGSEDANLNGVIDANEGDPNMPFDDVRIVDTDGDGLSDRLEATLMTDPANADSDNDGLLDGLEANPSHDTDGDGNINPLDRDSDDDGLFDGTEFGFNCDHPDTDMASMNCIADEDPATKTSPLKPDTDNGGATDGDEDTNKDGKFDAGERDPNDPSDDNNPTSGAGGAGGAGQGGAGVGGAGQGGEGTGTGSGVGGNANSGIFAQGGCATSSSPINDSAPMWLVLAALGLAYRRRQNS